MSISAGKATKVGVQEYLRFAGGGGVLLRNIFEMESPETQLPT